MGKREVAQGLQSLSNTFLQLGALEQRKQELGMQKQKMKEFIKSKKLERFGFMLNYIRSIPDPKKAAEARKAMSPALAKNFNYVFETNYSPEYFSNETPVEMASYMVEGIKNPAAREDKNYSNAIAFFSTTDPNVGVRAYEMAKAWYGPEVKAGYGGKEYPIGAFDATDMNRFGLTLQQNKKGGFEFTPKPAGSSGGSPSASNVFTFISRFAAQVQDTRNKLAAANPNTPLPQLEKMAVRLTMNSYLKAGIRPETLNKLIGQFNSMLGTEGEQLSTNANQTTAADMTPPSQQIPQETVKPSVTENVPTGNVTHTVQPSASLNENLGRNLTPRKPMQVNEVETRAKYIDAINLAAKLLDTMKSYYSKHEDKKSSKFLVGRIVQRFGTNGKRLLERWKMGEGLVGLITRSAFGDPDKDFASFDSITKRFVQATVKAMEGSRPSDKDREYIREFLPSVMQGKEVNFIRLRNMVMAMKGGILAYIYAFENDPTKDPKEIAELRERLANLEDLMKNYEAYFLGKQLKSGNYENLDRATAVAKDYETFKGSRYVIDAFNKQVTYKGQQMTRYEALKQINKELGKASPEDLVREAYRNGIVTKDDTDAGTFISAILDKGTFMYVTKTLGRGTPKQ